MEEIMSVFGSAQILGIKEVASSLLMSFVLCSAVSAVYRATSQGLSYSRSFIHTQILGGMIVALIIMAIGNNLARGLGILGTLAIVRFRTPVRDSRDMVFLFLCLGVGIACGARTFGVAVVGTAFIGAAALFLHWSPFASRREYEGLLRFALVPETDIENKVADVLRECCASFHLIALREQAQGDLMEYAYQIRLIDPSYQSDLVARLHEAGDVENPTLHMQRTTVEL